jgi:hypothetical protein
MRKRILERYSQTDSGQVIVDIATDQVADLYDDFDKHAPYLKKELDQGLVEYIIDSVREIGKQAFLIQFSLPALVDEPAESRVQTSLRNYFLYLRALEARELRRLVQASLTLFVVGIAILTASVIVNTRPAMRDVVLGGVIAQGLTIAAWVALWEALAMFLLNWRSHRRLISIYGRIARAEIRFNEV